MQAHAHMYTHPHTHTLTQAHTHAHAHTHTHTHSHKHTHMHMQTHRHTHTHTHTEFSSDQGFKLLGKPILTHLHSFKTPPISIIALVSWSDLLCSQQFLLFKERKNSGMTGKEKLRLMIPTMLLKRQIWEQLSITPICRIYCNDTFRNKHTQKPPTETHTRKTDAPGFFRFQT